MNENTRTQIAALENLRLPELQARFAEVLGESTRTPNRRHLIRRLTDALLAQAEGEQSATVVSQPEALPAEPLRSPETHCESCGQLLMDGRCTECEARNTVDEQRRDDDQPEPSTAKVDRPTEGTESAATPPPSTETAVTLAPVKLSKLTVPELQTRLFELTQRRSQSSDISYLRWKVGQAQKGRIPVGPRRERRQATEPQDHRVLPLRMPASLVDQLDAARTRLGLTSRMDLIRRALGAYLASAGEQEVAALLAPEA